MQIRIMLISAILIVTSLSIFGQITDKQSNKMDKSEQAVIALSNDYANAVVKGDAAAMERMLTDNYLHVFSPRGTVVTKAELINGYKNPTPSNVDSVAIDGKPPKVRMFGDMAITVTEFTVHYKYKDGKTIDRDFAGTMVAVKEKGQWKVASLHGSYIEPLPAANSSNDSDKPSKP